MKYAQKKALFFAALGVLVLMFMYCILLILGSLLDLKYDSVTEHTAVARLTNYNLSLATIIWTVVAMLIVVIIISLIKYRNKILKSKF